MSWRPGSDMEALRARAALLRDIRGFFQSAGVLEVETPICGQFSGTDPALEPLRSVYHGPGYPLGLSLFLQTSPEFFMKRLLSAGSGPIFQVCKAFRDGEAGRLHNPEFTLLEWYRPGFDHHALMQESAQLMRAIMKVDLPVEKLAYQSAFLTYCDLDPLAADEQQLADAARKGGIEIDDAAGLDRDGWLDLLMSHVIEPQLGQDRLTFIYDYPASQASLARLKPDDPRLASRFELYYQGVELANGFHELADAEEQQQRFKRDNLLRQGRGQDQLPLDENLLAALQQGLPDCAGVALGLDRLLMLKLGKTSLEEIMAFPLPRA